MSREKDTAEQIFEAAKEIFHQQGYDGARMREVAKRAGTNQAMLHYYYRSKDKLFEAVFQQSAMPVLPPMIDILKADLSLREKIERVVHTCIDLIVANPQVPAFMLQELRRNPNRLRQLIGDQARGTFAEWAEQISEAVERGEIRRIKPEHLLANLIALCVFPFMLQTVTGFDDETYATFLEERKQEVSRFIFNALTP